MKTLYTGKLFIFLAAYLTAISVIQAQAPLKMSYQAVIRDGAGELVVNNNIGVQISILQGSTKGGAVFVERHFPTTNDNGLVSLHIGEGNVESGSLEELNWAEGPYFIQTEIDLHGGNNYTLAHTSELLSVPYALYAKTFDGYEDLLSRIEALEEALDNDDPEPGTVTDIDGNVYQTVIIGNQQWMTENLRVTKYNNGNDIPTGLNDSEWQNTTQGAYAIYPHEGGASEDDVEGINSDEEMIGAYGMLYNWYAMDDERGLCPAGWSVPSDEDWTQLINYVIDQGYPNDGDNPNIAGNALKSCRQISSPLGGDCDTSQHPRWYSHGTHYGFDEFGFSALPSGGRWSYGSFTSVGIYGLWWSATELSGTDAWGRGMYSGSGIISRENYVKSGGFSVRCVREVDY